jgi:hypothetical protein
MVHFYFVHHLVLTKIPDIGQSLKSQKIVCQWMNSDEIVHIFSYVNSSMDCVFEVLLILVYKNSFIFNITCYVFLNLFQFMQNYKYIFTTEFKFLSVNKFFIL